jgi:hypothetical protein
MKSLWLAFLTGLTCLVCTAYALTSPPVNLPITITGNTGGTACAIGPNWTGAIPGPALAAGFTTCAANYDFSNTSNFTFNGHTYNFSNTATWLGATDGAGNTAPQTGCAAANPLIRWDYSNGNGSGLGCSTGGSVANDPLAGTNVLQLIILNGDVSTNLYTILLDTVGITAFPHTNSFVELVYRIQTNPPPSNSDPIDVWYYPRGLSGQGGLPGGYDGTIEVDFLEIGCCWYQFQGSGGWGTVTSNAGVAHPIGLASAWDGNYHKEAALMTSDRTTGMGVCWYHDQTALVINGYPSQTCSYGGQNRSDSAQDCVIDNTCQSQGPLYITNNALPSNVTRTGGNYTTYIQRITIWSCAGWTSNVFSYLSTNACSVSPFFDMTAPSY